MSRKTPRRVNYVSASSFSSSAMSSRLQEPSGLGENSLRAALKYDEEPEEPEEPPTKTPASALLSNSKRQEEEEEEEAVARLIGVRGIGGP